MRNNTKRIVKIMLIMVSMFTILFVSKELINKIKVPEKSINNVTKNKGFAIMVTNDNGIGYKEYDKDIWPEGYSLAKSECVDSNGNTVDEAISYDGSTNKVTLKTKKTLYCTLYFDRAKITLDILRENDPNEVISKELVGDLYRYQGLDKQYANDNTNNPDNYPIVDNNYICFGTNDKNNCLNNLEKYLYRIIGITANGSLKLIKAAFLNEENKGVFQWNNIVKVSSPYTGDGLCDGDKCEWPNSMIYKRLNGISNGSTKGADGNTNIFVNSVKYDYMKKDSYWYNLVENHLWLYGDTNSINSYDGNIMYEIENGRRDTTIYWPNSDTSSNTKFIQKPFTWQKNIEAKIGLQYIHDSYLAYPTGIPKTSNNAKKVWIRYPDSTSGGYDLEWSMTRVGFDGYGTTYIDAWRLKINDNIGVCGFTDYYTAVRPVFYLISNISLIGGGTDKNPYILVSKN